jgi:hypothetical protein
LQMIEIIREQKSNFQLVIGSQDGAWGSGAFSALVQIRCCKRGGGRSFSDAWDDMAPTHV